MERVNGKCEVVDVDDKLKVMGAFYEKINSPRYTNLGSLKRKVDTVMNNFKKIFHNYKTQNKTPFLNNCYNK